MIWVVDHLSTIDAKTRCIVLHVQLFDAVKGTLKESVSLTDQVAGATITYVQNSGSEHVAFAYTPG